MKTRKLVSKFMVFVFTVIIAFSCEKVDVQEDNKPPNAAYEVTPKEGGLSTIFEFDASISNDQEDHTNLLLVRWDIDSDGNWDADWTYEKTISHQYSYKAAYSVRLEVKDSQGLTDISKKTIAVTCNGVDTFTDPRDNKIYKTVVINGKTWFDENLNHMTENSWWQNNDAMTGSVYGRLYTWDAALNACPDGWHLPSDYEWKNLEMYLGMSAIDADTFNYRGTNQGYMLKTKFWQWADSGNGNDSVCFSARPGGYLAVDDDIFNGKGYLGFWWTSTTHTNINGTFAFMRRLENSNEYIYRNVRSLTEVAYSVRCVKD